MRNEFLEPGRGPPQRPSPSSVIPGRQPPTGAAQCDCVSGPPHKQEVQMIVSANATRPTLSPVDSLPVGS